MSSSLSTPTTRTPTTIIATLHGNLVHLGFENAVMAASPISMNVHVTDLAALPVDFFEELIPGSKKLFKPFPTVDVGVPLRLRATVDEYKWNCVATLHNGVVHIGRKVCTRIEDLLFMVQDSFADLFGMAAFRELQQEQAFMDRMYHGSRRYELLLRIEME